MPFDVPILLILNGITLALALAFLLIVLSINIQQLVSQVFAMFLVLVVLWNASFFLQQVIQLIEGDVAIFNIAYALSQAGFVGASVSLYIFMTVVVGNRPRRFRLLTGFYLSMISYYALFLIQNSESRADTLQAQFFADFFFVLFDIFTLYVTWRYRRKFHSLALLIGVPWFVLGQLVSFLNPELGIVSLSTTIGAGGALFISFAMIRSQVIRPVLQRGEQLESMHEVSVAITSRMATDAVLGEIAEQAADWLQADASGIFLKQEDILQLVAIHNLPASVLNQRGRLERGISGMVIRQKESIYLENYQRDWHGEDELPLAKETFGSVICVPLIYDRDVIGALMVIGGKQSHLLDKEDVSLLELLAAQAAVAISYGRLFNEQKTLTEQLAVAHEQLRTVLTSTDNPVLAVDRNLNLIFTNPAARDLFHLDTFHSRANLTKAIPDYALPKNYREALRNIKIRGAYRYEINRNGKTYLCHVAGLGERKRIEGFVAVLNDVTELKELDRIKSEMVRMTSHDLKNPLQAAFANLELLQEDIQTIENTEITLSVENIERQLKRMNRIISGILDLERIQVGSQLNEICHPREIVQEAVEELFDIAAEQRIELVTDIDENITEFMGDVDQFKRALVNLIENAVKFNEPGGEVLIRVVNRGRRILFSVSDDGIGIPEDLQPKVFERFYRGHQSGAEHISGSGLGLSLVKAVVESHNGRIWLQSQVRVGTTFYISIPSISRPVDVQSS
jgi:signal transduction histidine kinase